MIYKITLSPKKLGSKYNDWPDYYLWNISIIHSVLYKKSQNSCEILFFLPKDTSFEFNQDIYDNKLIPFKLVKSKNGVIENRQIPISIKGTNFIFEISDNPMIQEKGNFEKFKKNLMEDLLNNNNNNFYILCYPTEILFQSEISSLVKEIYNFENVKDIQLDILGYPYIRNYIKPLSKKNRLEEFIRSKFVPPIVCNCCDYNEPHFYYVKTANEGKFKKYSEGFFFKPFLFHRYFFIRASGR